MNGLEKKIGYVFKNAGLLNTALTHSSYANENKADASECNERLEFLGDAVLGFIVAEYLYARFPDLPEGRMTRLRAELVCERSLSGVAARLGLGGSLRLGRGEEHSGGRERPSIIADAFEAVIAAIYLDGGMEAARKHIMRFMPSDVLGAVAEAYDDYKTILQEIIQKNPEERVEYRLVGESGPDHSKSFTVRVMLNSNIIGEGTAHSKKSAEQLAAKEALRLMGWTKK